MSCLRTLISTEWKKLVPVCLISFALFSFVSIPSFNFKGDIYSSFDKGCPKANATMPISIVGSDSLVFLD